MAETAEWIADIKKQLRALDLTITREGRIANDTGYQIRTQQGPIINVYDKGTCNVQGTNKHLLEGKVTFMGGPRQDAIPRKVFVVYGHDEKAKTELEAMLRRWSIEPLVLDQLPSQGLTIIEKLEKYADQASFAVVLATPDDQGHPALKPDEIAYRARQNVVLELGMMLTQLGRSKVAVLIKGMTEMERPSDIQGLIYIPFKDSVTDAAVTLAKEMNAQGLTINLNHL